MEDKDLCEVKRSKTVPQSSNLWFEYISKLRQGTVIDSSSGLNFFNFYLFTEVFDSRKGWGFLTSQPRLDRLWDPGSLLSSGYREHFPMG